jgi:hypothetical protein
VIEAVRRLSADLRIQVGMSAALFALAHGMPVTPSGDPCVQPPDRGTASSWDDRNTVGRC